MERRVWMVCAGVLAGLSVGCTNPGVTAHRPEIVGPSAGSFEAVALFHGASGYSIDDITLRYGCTSLTQGGLISAGDRPTTEGSESVNLDGAWVDWPAVYATVDRPALGWSHGDYVDLEWRLTATRLETGAQELFTDETRVYVGGHPAVRLREVSPNESSGIVHQDIDAGETLVVQAVVSVPLPEALEVFLEVERGGYVQTALNETVILKIPAGLVESDTYSITTRHYKVPQPTLFEQPFIRLRMEAHAQFPLHEARTYVYERDVWIKGIVSGGYQ